MEGNAHLYYDSNGDRIQDTKLSVENFSLQVKFREICDRIVVVFLIPSRTTDELERQAPHGGNRLSE